MRGHSLRHHTIRQNLSLAVIAVVVFSKLESYCAQSTKVGTEITSKILMVGAVF